MEGPSPDKFAFAQWSEAIKSPVGTLSDGTVLRSKMEGPSPDKFAFAQWSEAIKSPVGTLSDGTVLRSKMEGPRPDKFALTRLDFVVVYQQLRFMAGSLGHKSSSDAVFYASDELFSVAFPFKPPWSFADTPILPIQRAERS